MQTILDWLGSHLAEILLAAITWLLGLCLAALRRLPRFLVTLAEQFATEAHKTPSQADDVAAQLALAASRALAGAVEATFGKAPSSAGVSALSRALPLPMPRRGPLQ